MPWQKLWPLWILHSSNLGRIIVAVSLQLFFWIPLGASAQEEFLRAFRPEMGKAQTRLGCQYPGVPGKDVAGQGKELGLNQHSLSLSHPIAQDSHQE